MAYITRTGKHGLLSANRYPVTAAAEVEKAANAEYTSLARLALIWAVISKYPWRWTMSFK